MSRPAPRGLLAGAALALLIAVAFLHACKDQTTDPGDVAAAKGGPGAGGKKVTLTVNGVGSTADGSLNSTRGGLKCTVKYSGNRVTTAGSCSKDFNPGFVVIITAVPVPGGVVAWTGCDRPVTDSPLSCEVTMTASRVVSAAFGPPANSYQMSVAGGSNGSGSVTSSPTGITCQISGGVAGAGCSATFANGAQVTLTATATTGSFIKAWSGGGCDVSGTGLGGTTGSCVVTMSQAQSIVTSFETNADEASIGQWATPITWPNVAIHAALMPDGTVLTYGRMNDPMSVWDPANPGAFSTVTEPGDLFCSGHTLLPDGRLLVAGGHSGTDHVGTKTTYIYDALSRTWSQSQDMQNGRWYPTNTTLASGEILTVSGGDTAAAPNLIPEVWQNGTWRALSSASRSLPLYPMMFAAPDGRVFMAGPGGSAYLSTTGTGGWVSGSGSSVGSRDYGSAVMYDVGKILLVGGGDPPTASAEVIDLNASARHTVGSMAVARRQMNATLLADGTILATGGSNAGGFNTAPTDSRVLTAEVWSPTTEQWRPLARMSHNRVYHSNALLLPDGRVLSVGSGEPAASGLSDDHTAEIFTPPYLFKADGTLAARPAITDAPTAVSYGQTFSVQSPDAASIVKATWIRLSSVTHSFNQNQRMNNLTVSAGGASTVLVTAPSSANLAPPGHYLLFLIDSNGVPSVARIVRIG